MVDGGPKEEKHRLHHALDALVSRAVGASPRFAGDPTVAVRWAVTLHRRDGRTEVGIGIARVHGAVAPPSE